MQAIARREGVTPRYVSRLLELAFLPPKLVEAILAGTQPAEMTAEMLTRGERGLGCGNSGWRKHVSFGSLTELTSQRSLQE